MSTPTLLAPHRMHRVPGLQTPEDLYSVIQSPAPLAGMRRPTRETPWAGLKSAGFDAVICLTDAHPNYDPSPLRVLHATSLEDLLGGRIPAHPDEERRRIDEAAEACVQALERGEGVVVHCAGGTGRTGTVLAIALCRLGGNLKEVVRYLDAVDRRRGSGWPESSWQVEVVRRLCGA